MGSAMASNLVKAGFEVFGDDPVPAARQRLKKADGRACKNLHELTQDLLQATDTPAPLFSATLPIYNAAMAMGHGMDDTAAVFSVLERWTQLTPKL
jgi:3-hydroxyisobutyrate dehydrogenase-like beta-hydroxyacid dehydrogenase